MVILPHLLIGAAIGLRIHNAWAIFILALAFLFSNNAFAAVPTSGLVGYWNFDEGSGTTAGDSLGSGNTGTLTNNVQGLTLHS